jgi:hypothetical protein
VIPRATAPRIAIVAIVLSFALALAVGILRTVNAEPVERAAEVAGNVAFAVVFAVPALLALLGLRSRPSLLVAAGALDLVLAFISLISFTGLVFVPPAVMFFVAAGHMRGEDPVCWAKNPTTGESFPLDPGRFVHGSSISMDSRDLPPGATDSGCTTDSISTGEAIAGISVIAAMLGAVWVLSKPPEPRARPAATIG